MYQRDVPFFKASSSFIPSKKHTFAIANQWHVVLGRIRHFLSFLLINILLPFPGRERL